MPRGTKKKAKSPTTLLLTPSRKPVENQSLRETENTYKDISDLIIKAVSSGKHYLHFLPSKHNIDNVIKLGALHMRDDYSNTSDLEKLGVAEGVLLPGDFSKDELRKRPSRPSDNPFLEDHGIFQRLQGSTSRLLESISNELNQKP